MSTTITPEPATESPSQPTPGPKTLSIKNVPHAVWRRARQNALASNLSFADYVVRLLGTAGPLSPAAPSPWDTLVGPPSTGTAVRADTLRTHHPPGQPTDHPEASE